MGGGFSRSSTDGHRISAHDDSRELCAAASPSRHAPCPLVSPPAGGPAQPTQPMVAFAPIPHPDPDPSGGAPSVAMVMYQQQQMLQLQMQPVQTALQLVTSELNSVLAELKLRRQGEEELRARLAQAEQMILELKRNHEYLDTQNTALKAMVGRCRKRGSESHHQSYARCSGEPSGAASCHSPPCPSVAHSEESVMNRRRTGVSSEVVPIAASLSLPSPSETEAKVVPKNEEERARLRRALANNILFASLEERDMQFIFDAMFQRRYQAGDVIMRQGDVGDNFYVLDEGEVKITIERDGGKKKVIMAQAGETFGELALMYGTTRAATIEAVQNSRCWVLGREIYRKILASQIMRKREKYTTFLKNIPVLRDLDPYEAAKIADVLDARDYADGEVIVSEGNVGDTFFIIEEGTVVVLKNGQKVGEMHQCEYFGELSLLFDRRRAATVMAKGSVRCLRLHKKYFNSYLSSVEEIMKRYAHNYDLPPSGGPSSAEPPSTASPEEK
eukprot:RCo004210